MAHYLPLTWKESRLEDLCTKIQDGNYGNDYPKANEWQESGIPFITGAALGAKGIIKDKLRYVSVEKNTTLKKAQTTTGDVIFPNRGASDAQKDGSVPLAFLLEDDYETSNINPQLTLLRSSSALNKSYLRYAICSPIFLKAFRENTKGSALAFMNLTKTKAIEIPLPPLAEQKVIAEKLDTLLAQVDNTKARLERIPEILKRFRQSVLAAAVSGKLTERWRQSNSNLTSVGLVNGLIAKNTHKSKPYESSTPPFTIDESWCWCRLGDIFSLKSGKTIPESEELKSGETPYFKVGDMNDASNQFYMQKAEKFVIGYERSLLPENSIIFPKRGGAIATNKKRILKKESLVDLNVMGIIVPNGIDTMFVYRWFETIDLAQLNTGSSIPQVNNGDIEPLWIPIPPHEEQTEIVRRVEELFAFADRIEQSSQAALSRVNNLTQSILAKAFRGELTADWREANPELISGENSAEALLARIKAERAKLSKKTKAKA